LLRNEGNPAQVVTLVLGGAVQICLSNKILTEYREVLARPRFKFDPEHIREVLAKIEGDGVAIDFPIADNLQLPDSDDVPFLATALASAADFLVTGNLAHYPEDRCKGCAVVSPAEFMQQWKTKR
jgi:uncharacterized protein